MSNVIATIKDIPVHTLVQLVFLGGLFTVGGLFLLVCGIKAVRRSKKNGDGMKGSLAILLAGVLGIAAAGWVDYLCGNFGVAAAKTARETTETEGSGGIAVDGDGNIIVDENSGLQVETDEDGNTIISGSTSDGDLESDDSDSEETSESEETDSEETSDSDDSNSEETSDSEETESEDE